MFHMPESRFVAFGAHLGLSLFVFANIAIAIYFILLPGVLFYSEGGSTILTLIGCIDVVLGPLITLIIYKKTKPGIKFDITVIALAQIAALIYGLYSLVSVRPLAVFYGGGSYTVAYEALFEDSLKFDKSHIKELNQLKPPLLGIEVAQKGGMTQVLFAYVIENGVSYFTQNDLYRPYQEMMPELKESGYSPEEAIEKLIISKNSPFAKLDPETYRIYFFSSSLKPGLVSVNYHTGEIMGFEK